MEFLGLLAKVDTYIRNSRNHEAGRNAHHISTEASVRSLLLVPFLSSNFEDVVSNRMSPKQRHLALEGVY